MQTSLFPYIWRNTKWQQLYILCIVLLSMPFYFFSLDLPKVIVNLPIQGKGFDTPTATQPFLEVQTDFFGFGPTVTLFSGFELERWPYLVGLSLLFLALVCINGWFKYYINVFKGRLGERMLRRLRYDLVDRVLRFPPNHFKRVKASEIATMIKDEVEPLGGFIGDAYVQPLFLGGQAVTAMAFILIQNLYLGLIALAIVLLQGVLIPRLRQRLLVLGKQRQLTARELAGRVGEVVDGIQEIRVNDTSNWERADISSRLGRIFFIRFELYNRKFFVKFLNNFLSQVTPFLFYLVGGYFALRGTLDVGQLVAVIAAYKELPSPIKELIDWDQQRQDVEIKFTQVVEQFQPDGMLPPEVQAPLRETPPRITAPIELSRVSITDDTGARLVENVTLNLAPGEHVAAIGTVNAGGESVAEAMVRLLVPTSGRIRVGGADLQSAPDALIGRRIAYAGPAPYLPNSSIRDCLLYAVRHHPTGASNGMLSEDDLTEAIASGNTTLDVRAEWIDAASLGAESEAEIDQRLHEVLKLVDMAGDVYKQGLRGGLDPASGSELKARVLEARRALRKRLESPELGKLVEPFDPARYNPMADVATNVLFGTAVDARFSPETLPSNPNFLQLLANTELDRPLTEMGRRIAETVLELFGSLPPNHPFFEQLTFMSAEELPDYRAIAGRVAGQPDSISGEDRARLLRLSLGYIEPEHRLGLLDLALQDKIVQARQVLRAEIAKGAVDFYDPDAYNSASSLEDNVLFGRVAYGIADGPERVRALIETVLAELDMQDVVFRAGLSFAVGSGGKRLTQVQRQKLAVARCLLKKPDFAIMNRSLGALDARSQRSILEAIIDRARAEGVALFCVLTTPACASLFDRVVVFEDGGVVEDGTPAALSARERSRFRELVG
ncbi:MAG: ABC transporter ATP-binding protein [Hyphomicrobiaceae bacterium]